MLRYQIRVTIYKYDEKSRVRLIDFPHNDVFVEKVKNRLESILGGNFMVFNEEDNTVYYIGVSNIEDIS
jgi:hypothetical protein